jgi:hypothetical protein
MVEDMGLKIIASGPLEWHYLCTKFHENLHIDKPTFIFGK